MGRHKLLEAEVAPALAPELEPEVEVEVEQGVVVVVMVVVMELVPVVQVLLLVVRKSSLQMMH